MIGAAAASSIVARNGLSAEETEEPDISAGPHCDSSSGTETASIDASLSRNAASTVSASASDQRVLGRKVRVHPVRCLVGGSELGDVCEQLLPQRF